MTIWAIADIHASPVDMSTGLLSKPMDVFGSAWINHLARLEEAWKARVRADDTVVIAGDTEWAMHLEDALGTLRLIASWPGRKVVIRGNHDYWWSSKTTAKVRKAMPPTMTALHNDSLIAEGFNLCGAKGSVIPGGAEWTEEDARLLNREVQRLSLSLESRDPALPTIVALHYPPLYRGQGESPYSAMLEDAGVAVCVYGHLHGSAAGSGVEGDYRGVHYVLVAGDAVGFQPVEIVRDGTIVAEEFGHNVPIKERSMTERELPLGELKDLAEEEIGDKRDEVGNEAQARELYDVPTQSAQEVTEEQRDEGD